MELLTAHVDGPPALPQRGGLVDAAFPAQGRDETGRSIEWRLGVQCWPENTAGWDVVHPTDDSDLDSDDVRVDYGNQDDDPAPFGARAVTLRTSVRGPKPSRGSDMQTLMRNRVQRRLDAVTSQAIAREVWTGRLTQAQPFQLADGYDWLNPTVGSGQYTNPFLNAALDAGDDLGDPTTPMRALGQIEAALGDRVAGGPLFIHIPLIVLNEVAWTLHQGTIGDGDDERPVLYTAKGSVVVPDTGYPGWGPGISESSTATDQGQPWMFGSGPVSLFLGEPHVYDDFNELVDISRNRVEMWAERDFLPMFDPSTVVGVAVTPT